MMMNNAICLEWHFLTTSNSCSLSPLSQFPNNFLVIAKVCILLTYLVNSDYSGLYPCIRSLLAFRYLYVVCLLGNIRSLQLILIHCIQQIASSSWPVKHVFFCSNSGLFWHLSAGCLYRICQSKVFSHSLLKLTTCCAR